MLGTAVHVGDTNVKLVLEAGERCKEIKCHRYYD